MIRGQPDQRVGLDALLFLRAKVIKWKPDKRREPYEIRKEGGQGPQDGQEPYRHHET